MFALPLHPTLSQPRVDRVNEAIAVNYQKLITLIDGHVREGKSIHERCRRDEFARRARNVGDPIGLTRLYSCFIILLAGVVLAVSTFISEQIVSKLRARPRILPSAATVAL